MKRIPNLSLKRLAILVLAIVLLSALVTTITSASSGYWRPHGHDCDYTQGGGPCMEWTGSGQTCCSPYTQGGGGCQRTFQEPHPPGEIL